MANTSKETGNIIKKYLTRFPDSPALSLAKKIYKENKLHFTNVESVRSSIRQYRGIMKHGSVKHTDEFKSQKTEFVLPESYATNYTPYKINQSKVLIISDTHFPYQNNEAIRIAINYGKEKKVNCILINGDLFDFAGISRHEKDWRQRSVFEEFEAVRMFLNELRKHFPRAKIVYKLGNHCFDSQTEILTKDGWKYNHQISEKDLFATYNDIRNQVEYHKAEKIHKLHYEGEMFKLTSQGIDMLVTPEHRLYFKYGSPKGEGFYRIEKAKNINKSSKRVSFKVSASQNNKEYSGITDDEIRICAWLHTDGSVKLKEKNKPAYHFFQRKSKVKLITDILDRLKYKYSTSERERTIEQICGKKLKNKNENSFSLRILRGRLKGHRLDELIKNKYKLSEWVNKLSDRQFDVFLSSLIDGDGSRHIKNPNTSWMLYGIKPFLDQVHSECVLHGYRSSITEYRPGTYRLNIFKTDAICIDGFKSKNSMEYYNGDVFCVTVPNGKVFVRRNGKVHVSGNCERWEKWLFLKAPEIFDDPEFKLETRLKLGELKIDIVKDKLPIKIGKLTVLHGHELAGGSGGVNPARATFLKTLESVLVGHYHKTSQHTEASMYQDIFSVHSTGCLCDLTPHYMPINKHNHGFAYVEHEIKTGNYTLHNLKIIKGKVY
jgi:predicted phosphodiesterase